MDTAVKPNDSKMMFREKMPELYNKHLVPLMFEAPAEHVSDLVKAIQPGSILELAAGTGVVTRAMARKLPRQVKITSTDKSEDMIKVAQSKMEGASNVTFQPADATKLSFDDAQFDLVVCQFGMSFFPDKLASLKETFRVLKPGGRCIYLIWDNWAEMTESPMVIAGGTIARLLKVDPRSLANAPYYDEDIIRKDFTTAGLTDFQLERKEFPSTAEFAKDAAMATVYASIARHGIEQQNVVTLEQAREAVEEALVDKFGSGRIEGRIKGVLVQARKE